MWEQLLVINKPSNLGVPIENCVDRIEGRNHAETVSHWWGVPH